MSQKLNHEWTTDSVIYSTVYLPILCSNEHSFIKTAKKSDPENMLTTPENCYHSHFFHISLSSRKDV